MGCEIEKMRREIKKIGRDFTLNINNNIAYLIISNYSLLTTGVWIVVYLEIGRPLIYELMSMWWFESSIF
jgi:hypothetical protein